MILNKRFLSFFRRIFLLTWVGITLAGWFTSVPPITVTADDGNFSSTSEYDTPVFPQSTPVPDAETSPRYQVPLALNSHDHFYFVSPVAQDPNNGTSSDFRYGYDYPDEDIVHTGLDVSAPMHTPVLAAGDGEVVFTGFGLMNGGGDPNDPYGKAVLIKHSFSYDGKAIYTVYGHLDRVDVEKGQSVKAGEQIGIIGMTGNTTGPHLHFEVRVEDSEGGRVQNPELWLAPTVDCGVLAGRVKNDYGYFMSAQTIYLENLESGEKIEFLTYADGENLYPDDYYKENFTLADIPAGDYQISLIYKYRWYRANITITPGTINFVYFHGKNGFTQEFPASPEATDFLP